MSRINEATTWWRFPSDLGKASLVTSLHAAIVSGLAFYYAYTMPPRKHRGRPPLSPPPHRRTGPRRVLRLATIPVTSEESGDEHIVDNWPGPTGTLVVRELALQQETILQLREENAHLLMVEERLEAVEHAIALDKTTGKSHAPYSAGSTFYADRKPAYNNNNSGGSTLLSPAPFSHEDDGVRTVGPPRTWGGLTLPTIRRK